MKLSYPSKIPCASIGLPAGLSCPTGAKLMQVPGSVCHGCYAMKGNYVFPNVKEPRRANLEELNKAMRSAKGRTQWVADMVKAINATGMMYFRWHDSGDIQNEAHLHMILDVCEQTPSIKHWMPTREYKIVQGVAFERTIPANCTIRLSAHMIGRTLEPVGPFVTSSVDAGAGNQCPATHNPVHKGKCLDCRACWDRSVGNVDYSKH